MPSGEEVQAPKSFVFKNSPRGIGRCGGVNRKLVERGKTGEIGEFHGRDKVGAGGA
jgi:hypothetical protein